MSIESNTNTIDEILDFLEVGRKLGINLPTHLREKLAKLNTAEGGKLKVALVGGFSEGKTSLAAAWLGMLPHDMKISQSESSNAVTIYVANDEVELIDTPGLFGFKEKNVEDGAAEKYKEITRKYVSESDLLLYVLNPSNPLKESHKEELNWLFRTLGLLSRTVFVIGRFDLVADVEDDADYERNLGIKTENIVSRLRDLIGLTEEEKKDLSIVGVAANPFDEGIANWLARPDEYARLSHIGDLRVATAKKVDAIGGVEEAKRQTCLAILSDVTERQLIPARQAADAAEKAAAIAAGKAKEEEPRLGHCQREAVEAQIALRTEVTDLFGDLITEAKNTGMDNFEEFFDRKIGQNGNVIKAMVENAFARELGPISQQLVDMGTTFVSEEAGTGFFVGALGKAAGKVSGNVNNTMILGARDWLMPALKFKPYGAINAAKFANGALAGIGLAVQFWSMWKEAEKKEEFEKARTAIVQDLEEQRSSLLEQISAPNFLSIYFPQIETLRSIFEAARSAAVEAAERSLKVREWTAEAEARYHRFGEKTSRRPGEGVIIDI